MQENRVFFTQGGNFASNFPSRQACQNAVNHVFGKQIYVFFLKIDQVLRFCTKNNGIVRKDFEENVLC